MVPHITINPEYQSGIHLVAKVGSNIIVKNDALLERERYNKSVLRLVLVRIFMIAVLATKIFSLIMRANDHILALITCTSTILYCKIISIPANMTSRIAKIVYHVP